MVSAFSVPKGKRDQKPDKNPGPGSYNPETSPTKQVKHTEPLYSFGKDGRRNSVSHVPGPGQYQPTNSLTNEKKPSFSMMAKRELSSEKLNVGPGQYSPSYNHGKDKSPSFSMRGKYGQKSEAVPGPGQYEYKNSLNFKEKGHDFGKDARSKYLDTKVPGPGSYAHESAVFKYGSKQEPSYGFGSRIAYNTDGKVPGPGSYEAKKETYSHIGGIVGKDLRDSLVMSKTPGPGNYEHDANFKEKLPSWSLSKTPRDNSPSLKYNVGPGQYEHLNGYKKVIDSAPSYNIANRAQKLKYDISAVPGPGSYQGQLMKSRKSIKIAEKTKDMSRLNVPGPGQYEQLKYDNSSWQNGSGRYSVARDPKLKQYKSEVPGPGQYENKSTNLKDHKGKITFDHGERLKAEKGKNPGPGQYDLKPTFANVPAYLLPNNSSKL